MVLRNFFKYEFKTEDAFSLHFENWSTIYSYFDFDLKIAVFDCLTNAPAPPPIALESCSGLKRIGQSSRLHSKKRFLVGGCEFFVTDVISEVVLGSFWLMLPGLGPNC